MSNKRVKRVHISGWLDVFLTDTIMARIAHYLSTPTLFQLLLGVNKELRKKATTSKRWNQIMEYGKRMVKDLRIIYPYLDNQNLLAKFLKRLYAKSACSFCFQMIGGWNALKNRPDSEHLRICASCGRRRGFVLTPGEFATMIALSYGMYAKIPPTILWKHELDYFCPTLYTREELVDVIPWRRRDKSTPTPFNVVDFNGDIHLVRLRQEHEMMIKHVDKPN
jgi:hypothetical protein